MVKFKYIRRSLSDRMEIPEDTLGNIFRLQIIGDCAILSGCRKILKYKSEEIVVLTKESAISFCGEHLKCVYFFEGTIEIKGNFSGIGIQKR